MERGKILDKAYVWTHSSTNNGISILRLSDLQGTGEFRSDNPEIRTIRIRYMYLDRTWFRNFVRICRSILHIITQSKSFIEHKMMKFLSILNLSVNRIHLSF